MKFDVIIVGAGSAGLIAARELIASGLSVCIVEAAPRAGGRIATVFKKGFEQPVETGAEFVHGKLPLTLSLLNEYKIPYHAIEGKMIGVRKGRWSYEEEHEVHWNELMHRLKKQKEDDTIINFLNKYFSGKKYASLSEAVRNFAEGFDLADTEKASILSIKKEWQHEHDEQYRIPDGYQQLIENLYSSCINKNAKILFKTEARKVLHEKNNVTVITHSGKKLQSRFLIVTASIAVLQKKRIQFDPVPVAHINAIQQLGFGSIIKFILQFKTPFWEAKDEKIGFLLSDKVIPTWWTQLPLHNGKLTGWLGGPSALQKSKEGQSALLHLALRSLAGIFHTTTAALKRDLKAYLIVNWQKNKYVLGGYSYNTLYSEKAISILSRPVSDTIWFAGEAYYDGASQGTVEAALQSGLAVAKKIIKCFN